MKNLFNLMFLTIILVSCNQSKTPNSEVSTPITKTNIEALKTIELNVTGMTCEGCEKSVETALAELNGVVSAKASHLKSTTIIEYDSTKLHSDLIAQTIDKLGYHVQN